ncbi:MAG TPA: ABC transporter substrate-binding protein [Candidatus Micrarchaeia archaeon]|nr:ABC transporter substrate-binding protein [Candidatus Micrarchaeia archaeon]
MNWLRGRLSLAALVGVALAGSALGATSTAARTTRTQAQSGAISVGVVAPFTGPAAEFGTLLGAPCYAATMLINKAGGVMGHKFTCVPVDDTGDAADAVPNVTRAIATVSNFDLAIGLESNTAATTVPLVNRAHIPIITTNGLVAYDKTKDKYFWRLTPADNANGAAFMAFAAEHGWRRAAVVFENNITATGNLPGVLAAASKLHTKIALNLTIPADAASYSSVVERVIAAKPKVLVFSADPQSTATFLSEYSQLNGGKLPPMVTATDALTPDFFNAVSKAVGVHYITHSIFLVGSYFSNTTPAFFSYRKAMFTDPHTKKIAGVITTVGPPASAFDGINIAALAMLEAHSTVGSVYNSYITKVVAATHGAQVVHTFAAGKAALAAGRKIQFQGVVGPVSFNKYHNFAGEFAATVFRPNKSAVRVAIISGGEVSQLLG